MRTPGGEAGMTLVEMLVVLAIIGVSAGAIALGLGVATRGNNVAAEANRLAAGLRLASDDVLVTERPTAFQWTPTGYAFPGAAPVDALAPHTLPRGIRLAMQPETGSVPIDMDGGAIVAQLTAGDERWTVRYDGLTAVARREPAA